MSRKNKISSVFVLGSTSEIAREICTELAINGCNEFHLAARNEVENNIFANKLRKKFNSKVSTEKIDFYKDFSLNKKNIIAINDFDLYLICAGSLGNAKDARFDSTEGLKISFANYIGLIPWITSITNEDRLNKPMRMWVLSSVAYDLGRPSNYHYGAAKAALNKLCEGLIFRCYKKPFSIRVIKAGFVGTSKTLKMAPSFLCITPKLFAKNLLRNIDKKGFEYLPWWWKIVMVLIKIMPAFILSRL